MQELHGLLILNKSEGMTSQSAVNRAKRLLGAKKAGHTGTLDPMATGVLPILLGQGTKLCEFLTESRKHYRAELCLGVTTDTEDMTGEVLSTCDTLPTEEAVLETVSRFVGELMQVPPMYSALKKDGQKLCNLARRGVVVEREARPITVYAISAERLAPDRYSLDVVCSKGTYIRTLCADIGKALSVGGAMAGLTRVETAGFSLSDAVTLYELEQMTEEERRRLVRPIDTLLSGLPKLSLPPFFARLASSGCEIYQKKLGTSYPLGTLLALYDGARLFAVGEVRDFPPKEDGSNGNGGSAIKTIRQFVTDKA